MTVAGRAGGARLDDDAGDRLSLLAAVGVAPAVAAEADLTVRLAVERVTYDGGPLPGTDGADATRLMIVLSTRAEFALP
ncbi:MAG: hypothetical protein R2939_18210 [Kofleriaceae bacterium]